MNDVLDDIYTPDTEGESIDGVELHLPHISGENAIALLESVLGDGYDLDVTEMVVEIRQ